MDAFFKVPYTDISHKTKSNLWPVIHRWKQKTDSFELVNAYGLFRRFESLAYLRRAECNRFGEYVGVAPQ